MLQTARLRNPQGAGREADGERELTLETDPYSEVPYIPEDCLLLYSQYSLYSGGVGYCAS